MKYNFDITPNRKNTYCEKWDYMKEEFGKADLLPLWVADMDFSAPDAILSALHKKIDQGALGYPIVSERLLDAITGWQERRHDWCFDRDSIVWSHGVVAGLAFSVAAYTKPGDGVIIQPPIYHPFYRTVLESGRRLIENPLIYKNGKYVMNLEELESLITPTCRTLLLCSPHNPVGRVWTVEEIKSLADLAKRKNLLIISDEIHEDIVYSDAKHTSIGALPGMEDRCVTFTAASKTFNIPGLKASAGIIQDPELRGQYNSVIESFHLNSLNIMGATAMETAFTECDGWVDELIAYLEENRNYTESFIQDSMPRVRMDHPEGTYIFWLDFRDFGMDSEQLNKFLVEEAGVALSKGTEFGPQGNGFARINIGTSKAILETGLEKIANALKKHF